MWTYLEKGVPRLENNAERMIQLIGVRFALGHEERSLATQGILTQWQDTQRDPM